MKKHRSLTRALTILLLMLSVPLLYLISRYSYNLFHSLTDGLTIVIAACAFVVVWNSRRNVDNHYFTYVGISLLFFAFLDLIHMLGNKNMGVFPGYGNLGPTFYVASRYVLSISLVIAPLFVNRRLNTLLVFVIYSLATSLILLSVFYWDVFPVCIVEGVGLTRFKVISDYIICLILLGAAGLLFINRQYFDPRVRRILVFSIILSIATGLMFTLYTDPFGVTNMIGHLFQIASFYLIYVAIIETSMTRPQEILFRKLKQHEEKLTENVRQLDHANAELQQEIAERRQAEEALRQSEQRWATTLGSIGDAVIATDIEGRVSFVNAVAEGLTGWTLKEASLKPVTEVFRIINERTRTDVESPVARVLREGMIVGLAEHTILIRRDGTEVPIDDSGAPIRDADGQTMGVVLVFRDITDRKQADEALRESEEHYRSLFDNMLNGFAYCKMLFDQGRPKDFTYLNVNSAFEVLTGLKNVTGRKVSEVIPGIRESDPELFEIYGRVALTGTPERFERYVVALGMWFSISVYSPRKEHFVAVFDVITERKRAEENLRKAHDELEQRVRERTDELRRQAELLNLTQDAIIARDLNQRVFFWNRGAEERYGWSSDEVKGKMTDDLLQTVFPQPLQEIEEELLLRGRWEGEVLHTTRDDRKIIVASRRALRRDEDGKPIAVLEINNDITEHKRADEERQRLAAAVEHTGEAVIITDSHFIIHYVNPAFTQATGYAGEEVVGRDGKLLSSDADFSKTLREMLVTGHPWSGVYQFRHKNGTVFPASTSISSITDSSGAITYYVVVAHDISEQQRLEDQLRQSLKMEAIGTLAGGIAHDFNNVLAAMIGFSELAADGIPADSKAQRHLKRVHEAGLRARELVKQILAFSRKSEGERKQISLTPLVHETHALLRSSLPTTIQMPLAITTSDDYVCADSTQLQQVLMNLATNAAHAMRDGGQLTIGVSSVTFPQDTLLPDPGMEPGAYVKLTVEDTGTGMTEEVRQRIFEPFFTTKEVGKGTGMGLAVVYGIVKSHGGTVTVQSEVGKGSTFTVFLPRVRKSEVKKEETTTSTLPTGTEQILFVDDEELLVEMARNMLESLGYHVTVVKHPTDAWNLFLEDPSRFDLIITDQTMPNMTGVALAEKMLRVRKEMPIILCTGYSEIVSADKAKKAGISEFVMKPVVRKELAETIRRVLDTKAQA